MNPRPYPERGRERDRWILEHRHARNPLDPLQPFGFVVEDERAESGKIVPVATVFLTNRECPWRCLMCDLWKNTLSETVPVGAIPAQIEYALARLGGPCSTPALTQKRQNQITEDVEVVPPSQIKLYNSGSFFDSRAIPVEDYQTIAARVRPFERVIVECHPALVNDRCLQFRDLLESGSAHRPARVRLEVAMGLETAHPQVLDMLNKQMTLDQFQAAADFLHRNDIALRVFVLVKPPFMDEDEAVHWAGRSIDFAFDCGATAVSLIPTRLGNGALEALALSGQFSPPKLATVESAAACGIRLQRGRVFVDLWDLEKFSDCPDCLETRRARLRAMNLRQTVPPAARCLECGSEV